MPCLNDAIREQERDTRHRQERRDIRVKHGLRASELAHETSEASAADSGHRRERQLGEEFA